VFAHIDSSNQWGVELAGRCSATPQLPDADVNDQADGRQSLPENAGLRDRTFTTRARKVPAAVHRGGRNERRRCEATSGGNPWFYRFELAADDRRYPGAKEEFEMPAARQFDVLEVWRAANLQATRQRRADRIALRVNRRQPDAGGKAIVGEVAQKR